MIIGINTTKYIAILRGINVGGKRKILMTDLKKLFVETGFTDIVTYIQSGNVIFNAEAETDTAGLGDKIERNIRNRFGFEVPVIVRTLKELADAISGNPFIDTYEPDIERLHLTFLKLVPQAAKLKQIDSYDFSPDKFDIQDKNVFVYCLAKYSDSKLTNNFFESRLKVPATTRNWKTVLKLSELAK
jgi:uncharacterized protein (DUF1697 family)